MWCWGGAGVFVGGGGCRWLGGGGGGWWARRDGPAPPWGLLSPVLENGHYVESALQDGNAEVTLALVENLVIQDQNRTLDKESIFQQHHRNTRLEFRNVD